MLLGSGAQMHKTNQQNRSMAKHVSYRNFKQRRSTRSSTKSKGEHKTQPLQFGSNDVESKRIKMQEKIATLIVMALFVALLAASTLLF